MNRLIRPLAIPLVVALATGCTSATPSSVAVPPSTTSSATPDAIGDLDAAVDELRSLLRVRPDLYEARLTLAAVLVARQEWPAARAELERALASQPDLVQ